MSCRDILVFVDGSETGRARGLFAARFAVQQRAHLSMLAFAPNSIVVAYGEPGVIPPMPQSYFDELREKGEHLLKEMEDAARAEGLDLVETRLLTGVAGDLPQILCEQARHGDLTIIGQPREGALWSGEGEVVSRLLSASGRPLLIVPYVGVKTARFETVLAAWDGSQEASRALHDALWLMRAAKKTILYVGEPAQRPQLHGDQPGADIARHLARHDIEVEVREAHSEELDVGELILSRAASDGVDLIVMGGYHHSRLRELFLGGVTKTLLEHMPVPVFMSH